MKRSERVVLRLLPVLSVAAIASGCGSRGQTSQPTTGWQTCVDRNDRVVDDNACVEDRRATHPFGYIPMYRWYYYPYGSSRYPVGYGIPSGGRYIAEPYAGLGGGSPVASPAGAVRYGGFGSTGASAGAGE